MAYIVDDSQLMATSDNWQAWVLHLVESKIEEIKILDDPYSQGGKYRGFWVYTTGKLQIVTKIDDDARTIFLLKLIKLP